MKETLIVAELADGIAIRATVCLPASSRERPGPGGTLVMEWLEDRLAANHGIPPYEWPSLCGKDGVVYVKGGVFEHAQICAGCATIAAKVLRAA